MVRLVLILTLILPACGAVHYEHVAFAADGHTPTARYTLDRWQWAMDSQATAAHVVLADGATLDLTGAIQQPDKTVVGALTAIGQSIVGLGGLAFKLIGL